MAVQAGCRAISIPEPAQGPCIKCNRKVVASSILLVQAGWLARQDAGLVALEHYVQAGLPVERLILQLVEETSIYSLAMQS